MVKKINKFVRLGFLLRGSLTIFTSRLKPNKLLNKVPASLNIKYSLPKMLEVEKYINNCEILLRNIHDQNSPIAKFNLTPIASYLLDRMHINVFLISVAKFIFINIFSLIYIIYCF